jgi:cytochrome c551
MNNPNKRFAWYVLSLTTLFLITMVLAACGQVNSNSTAISQTIRPVTVDNNITPGSLPTDATKTAEQAAGATSTPGRATPTLAPAGTTPAGNAPTTAPPGGNTPGAATTAPATGGVTVNATQAQSVFRRVCVSCHPNNGGTQGIGPALRGPFTNNVDNIVGIVRNGRGSMPKFTTGQISDADLQNMAAWIKQTYHP